MEQVTQKQNIIEQLIMSKNTPGNVEVRNVMPNK